MSQHIASVRKLSANVALISALGAAALPTSLMTIPAKAASSGPPNVDGRTADFMFVDPRNTQKLAQNRDSAARREAFQRGEGSRAGAPAGRPSTYPAYPPPPPPPSHVYPNGITGPKPYFEGRTANEHLAPGYGDRKQDTDNRDDKRDDNRGDDRDFYGRR